MVQQRYDAKVFHIPFTGEETATLHQQIKSLQKKNECVAPSHAQQKGKCILGGEPLAAPDVFSGKDQIKNF